MPTGCNRLTVGFAAACCALAPLSVGGPTLLPSQLLALPLPVWNARDFPHTHTPWCVAVLMRWFAGVCVLCLVGVWAQVWGASVMIADMVATGAIDCAGRSVLELGCGCGIAGLAAAVWGAAATVHLTDNAEVCAPGSNLHQNVAGNGGGAACGIYY